MPVTARKTVATIKVLTPGEPTKQLTIDVPALKAAPHMSLYVGKRVQRVLKEIALEYDRKPHDILIEAVDLVLKRYGRPTIAKLSGG
jgi:hypothetical protein